MPAQPAWFHRLDEILGALRSIESTRLDRLAVERLFGVRERYRLVDDLDLARHHRGLIVSRSRRSYRSEGIPSSASRTDAGTRRREAIGASQKRWFRFRDGLE